MQNVVFLQHFLNFLATLSLLLNNFNGINRSIWIYAGEANKIIEQSIDESYLENLKN